MSNKTITTYSIRVVTTTPVVDHLAVRTAIANAVSLALGALNEEGDMQAVMVTPPTNQVTIISAEEHQKR